MCGAAGASTIHYDEAVSGDLDWLANPLTTFALDIGVNTVTGTISVVAPGEVDFDSFAFTVPVGANLVSASVALFDQTGNSLTAAWSLYQGSAISGGGTYVESLFANPASAVSLSSVPLGAGVYNVPEGSISDNPPASSAYTFTFDVEPDAAAVPEPRAVAPLSVALLGLAELIRRRLVSRRCLPLRAPDCR
jgi:hypothetical protein